MCEPIKLGFFFFLFFFRFSRPFLFFSSQWKKKKKIRWRGKKFIYFSTICRCRCDVKERSKGSLKRSTASIDCLSEKFRNVCIVGLRGEGAEMKAATERYRENIGMRCKKNPFSLVYRILWWLSSLLHLRASYSNFLLSPPDFILETNLCRTVECCTAELSEIWACRSYKSFDRYRTKSTWIVRYRILYWIERE